MVLFFLKGHFGGQYSNEGPSKMRSLCGEFGQVAKACRNGCPESSSLAGGVAPKDGDECMQSGSVGNPFMNVEFTDQAPVTTRRRSGKTYDIEYTVGFSTECSSQVPGASLVTELPEYLRVESAVWVCDSGRPSVYAENLTRE